MIVFKNLCVVVHIKLDQINVQLGIWNLNALRLELMSKHTAPLSGDISSCCLRDDELGRLTLAGMNPLSIERLKVRRISSYFATLS